MPNPRGRPPTLDLLKVAADIARLDGNLSAVAKKHGVTRGAIQRMVRENESLAEVLLDAREGMKDIAEKSLYSAVKNREGWAVCFFLKTQARDRGYTEKAPEEKPPEGQVPVDLVTAILAALGSTKAGTIAPAAGEASGTESTPVPALAVESERRPTE